MQAILDQLREKGIKVHVAPYSVWGDELSRLLRRAKVVLNLHHYEAKILETCRIMESLSYGALVSTLCRPWNKAAAIATVLHAKKEYRLCLGYLLHHVLLGPCEGCLAY